MSRRTLAEDWEELARRLKAAWLAVLHSVGLHTRAELDAKTRQAESFAREARAAFAQKREAERLLVLLSEPLKDWDLEGFPNGLDETTAPPNHPMHLDSEMARHLWHTLKAYRLTASAVAPLRMGRVVDDKARRRGWDDEPVGRIIGRDHLDRPIRRNLP